MTLADVYKLARRMMTSDPSIEAVGLSQLSSHNPAHWAPHFGPEMPVLFVDHLPAYGNGPQFICRDGDGDIVHATPWGQTKLPA